MLKTNPINNQDDTQEDIQNEVIISLRMDTKRPSMYRDNRGYTY